MLSYLKRQKKIVREYSTTIVVSFEIIKNFESNRLKVFFCIVIILKIIFKGKSKGALVQ